MKKDVSFVEGVVGLVLCGLFLVYGLWRFVTAFSILGVIIAGIAIYAGYKTVIAMKQIKNKEVK